MPQSATKEAFKIARNNHIKTILNPAPAAEIDSDLLKLTDIIIPNEFESELITGIRVDNIASMQATAHKFSEMGIDNTIITLGERGVFYSFKNKSEILPALKVEVSDTTAAGDTFIGALAAKLNVNFENLISAINYAQKASAITIQRLGAQVSIPTSEEINSIY